MCVENGRVGTNIAVKSEPLQIQQSHMRSNGPRVGTSLRSELYVCAHDVCVCVCVKVGEWGWKERGREKELERRTISIHVMNHTSFPYRLGLHCTQVHRIKNEIMP